jgi:glycosyltransferase involved in cell wall biosynthesis
MKLLFVYAFHPNSGVNTSPHSITNNLHKYLQERCEVEYVPWDSCSLPAIAPDTVLLGHPHYDPNTIVQTIFRRDIPMAAKYSIHPLHTARTEDNWPFDHIAQKADGIFSICGPYWYDTIDSTIFSSWKEKITRLDMAVDCDIWRHYKTEFNPPGQRGVVYVGSSMPQKNLGYLQQIVQSMPDVQFRWYGGSGDHPMVRLPNMQIFGRYDFPNQEIMAGMFSFGDIFLNVSSSDANPTTLLEFGLAGGMIPICTQTSGYWKDESFINVPHDLGGAIQTIRQWLSKPSDELLAKSLYNRQICEKNYTWDLFCSRIWDVMSKHF